MLPVRTIVRKIQKILRDIASFLIPFISVAAVLLLVFDIGFQQTVEQNASIKKYYSQFVFIIFFLLFLRIDYEKFMQQKVTYLKTKLSLFLIFATVWLYQFVLPLFIKTGWLVSASGHYLIDIFLILFLFITEISIGSLSISKFNRNPASVFLFSFAFVILAGALLLMLPRSTYNGISFTDALFTSTSAVCVTGLIVVDTANYFTPLGQNIIALLIQIGGLGILTFTSFFGMYLRTSISFQDQIMLGNMTNEDRISNIFKTVVRIIVLTISMEVVAAICMYFTLEADLFSSSYERARFALFHSISAFCNAGFSLLKDGLYDVNYRTNYYLQIIIMILIVTGGLGFNIIFNYLKFLKYNITQEIRVLFYKKNYTHLPRLININSKIVIITTFCLIIFGFVMNLILEWNNTLEEHSFTGKIITALFASITPRTAGFNTINMAEILPATILIYYLLMLIGGSPGSTAGGIKTTTVAVLVLNALSLAKAKDRVEIYRRELSVGSLRRALSVISLSLLFIGTSVFIITIQHPEISIDAIIFECISAFSTVGLSLGITPLFSEPAKIVLVFTMFIGRIGTLTLMVALFRKVKTLNYSYPTESILIS